MNILNSLNFPNAALMFIGLKDWEERKAPELHASGLLAAADFAAAAAGVRDHDAEERDRADVNGRRGLAAFDLLDKKLCGEWEGLPKCPEDESGMYEKYVKEHPTSPKNAEA